MKMKAQNKTLMVNSIFFLLLIVGATLIFLSPQEAFDSGKEECDELQGCEKTRCYTELPQYVMPAQKSTLINQHCLFKSQMELDE